MQHPPNPYQPPSPQGYGAYPPQAGYAQGQGHAAQDFPPTLDQVPPEGQAVETFAFTPGALAIGGVLGLLGSFIGIATSRYWQMDRLFLPLGCFVGAVLFGFWEIWRRTHRTALAFRGAQMAVYRSGALQSTGYRTQLTIYQLNIVNTVREILGFGFFGFITFFAGLGLLRTNLGDGLCCMGAAIGFIGALISSLYARIGCRHFFVPKGNGTEQVMFTRSVIDRFGI